MIYSYIIHPFLAQQKKKEMTIADMSFARPDCRDRNLLLRFPSPPISRSTVIARESGSTAQWVFVCPSLLFAVLGDFNTAKEGIIATQRAFVSPSRYLTPIGYNKRVRQYCAVGIRRPSPLFAILGNFNTAKEGIIATQRAFARPALLVAMIPSKRT